MKNKIFTLFLGLMLLPFSWLVAQHAVWWDDPPPPGSNTTRDHSVSYGNGFAWQVALGTSGSEDSGFDAIAVSSGGYLVVGKNVYFSGYTVIKSELVLYRLTEEGDLLWEKGYSFDDYKYLLDFSVIEKPDGTFFIFGLVAGGTNHDKFVLIDVDSVSDTLSIHSWESSPTSSHQLLLKLTKSTFDDTFFLSYRERVDGVYITKSYNLSYTLDTLAYTVFPPYHHRMEYVTKPFGYIYKGGFYDEMVFYNLINFHGEPIDSFPDPFGQVENYSTRSIQSLRNGNNFFSRKISRNPDIISMAITNNVGEVLYGGPSYFSEEEVWWYDRVMAHIPLREFSDGSICMPFQFYLDIYDNESIGLVKLNSMGQLLGDTTMSRYEGQMNLAKVLEGGDGRPIIFGTGENGPFGGTITGNDIFVAKIENWNPVGVPTVETTATQSLKVYPNPTPGAIRIAVSGTPDASFTYDIYNSLGTSLTKGRGVGEKEVDLSRFGKGSYMIVVGANDQRYTLSVMVK